MFALLFLVRDEIMTVALQWVKDVSWLPEVATTLPELWPRLARIAAEEDVGMIFALLVLDAVAIGVVADEFATLKECVDVVAAETENDQGSRRRIGITAQPIRVGPTDWLWQSEILAIHSDRSGFAVIGGKDAGLRTFGRRQ